MSSLNLREKEWELSRNLEEIFYGIFIKIEVIPNIFMSFKIVGILFYISMYSSLANSEEINAFHYDTHGCTQNIKLYKVKKPLPSTTSQILHIKAAGVNRLDILQREGKLALSKDMTPVMGVEASGYILNEDGSEKTKIPVMALLSGGGYGEFS